MTKVDLRAASSKEVKTNVYLLLVAESYVSGGRTYVEEGTLRSCAAIARTVRDVRDARTVRKTLDALKENGYLSWDGAEGAWLLDEGFENRFAEVTPAKAGAMCRELTNDQSSLLLHLRDKDRYFRGAYTTTCGRLAQDAWDAADNSRNRERARKALDELQGMGKLRWRKVPGLGTWRVEIKAVCL